MHMSRYLLVSLSGLWLHGTAVAFNVAAEFSAQAVQQAPMRPEYHASMYVSKNAVRTDSTINGVAVVEILNSKEQTRTLIVAKDKIFLQQKRTPDAADAIATKPTPENPCAGIPQTTCQKLGVEMVNQRKTEKWEFTREFGGQTFRSLHWIDVQRRMPIREFLADGTVTELRMQGTETINGRKTEKWILQMTRSDGQQMTSTQWYDPQLKMAIREELPGGYIRELKDIKIGKQDEHLFEIPSGYTRVDQLPDYLKPPQPPVVPGQ